MPYEKSELKLDLIFDYIYEKKYIDDTIRAAVYYGEEYIISDICDKDIIELYVSYNYFQEEESDRGFELYQIDNDKWNSVYNILKDNIVLIETFSENLIKAKIDFDESKSIYTSIPFDKGWHVYIDGLETKTFSVTDALLAFDVEAGEHDITLNYSIPYFNLGLIITFISMAGTIILQIFIKKERT